MYPDDSVQYYTDSWWLEDEARDLTRGRLVRAFEPYFGEELRRLVLEGRSDARDQGRALFKIEPFAQGNPLPPAQLPVAAMPRARGEDFFAVKGKYRPALIVSTGGPQLPRALRRDAPHWQVTPALLLAPYFGVDQDGSRGGFRPEFITRVRRAEYPHFCWDRLPIGGCEESLLRLDYLFPMPKDTRAVTPLPHKLSAQALAIVDTWLGWLFSGTLDADSELCTLRDAFPTSA